MEVKCLKMNTGKLMSSCPITVTIEEKGKWPVACVKKELYDARNGFISNIVVVM